MKLGISFTWFFGGVGPLFLATFSSLIPLSQLHTAVQCDPESCAILADLAVVSIVRRESLADDTMCLRGSAAGVAGSVQVLCETIGQISRPREAVAHGSATSFFRISRYTSAGQILYKLQ